MVIKMSSSSCKTDQGRKRYHVQQRPWWPGFEVPQGLCMPTPTVLAYFGSSGMDNSPAWRTVWSIAVTEGYVLVAILTAQSAVHGLEFDTRCLGTDIYHSIIVPVGRISQLPYRIIHGSCTLEVGEVMAGYRHPPAVLNTIFGVIEDYPYAKIRPGGCFILRS